MSDSLWLCDVDVDGETGFFDLLKTRDEAIARAEEVVHEGQKVAIAEVYLCDDGPEQYSYDFERESFFALRSVPERFVMKDGQLKEQEVDA